MASTVIGRPSGVPLSRAGGLPVPMGSNDPFSAAKRKVAQSSETGRDLALVRNLSPSLAAILRPQAAYRWLLPYLASITPTYIESVLRGALAGNHVQAWELFDLMIDTDPEIASCVSEWIDGIMAKRFLFEPWRHEDEEPSEKAVEKGKLVSAALRSMRPDPFNDENDLFGTVRDVAFSRFHGQSLLEVDWTGPNGGGLNLVDLPDFDRPIVCPRATWWVHPVCYAWDINGRLGLRAAIDEQFKQASQAAGKGMRPDYSLVEPPAWNWITSQPRPTSLVDFPENKFLVSITKAKAGTVLGGCVLRPLAWWWCASNFCGDWLLNYAQLFGIPFRKATHSPNATEPEKAELRQMLQACGATGYILLKQGNDVEFLKDSGSAGQSPQAFLFHFADSQKRKVILHQTMTGGQHDSMGKGGGKAFGEVEDDTKAECIEAGAKAVCQVINQQLIPMLLTLNYGEGGDLEAPTAKLVSAEVGNLSDAQRDQVLTQLMDVPESYMQRKYGVPNPKPGEKVCGIDIGVLGAQAAQQQAQHEDQMDAQKQQAKAAAQQRAQQAEQMRQQQRQGPQDQEKQSGQEDDTAAEARRAVEAKAESAPDPGLVKTAADALHETLEPLLARLQAIEAVTDKNTRVKLLRKLLKDHASLAAAIRKDDSLAKAVTPALVKKFLQGLKAKRAQQEKQL